MARFDSELRKMAKRANQRMVRLEKAGMNTPALMQAQAILEMMGRKSTTAKGRRFSETGRGTENEIRQQKAAIERFLNARTSTVSGTQSMKREIYNTANKNYNLEEAGISEEDYFELWENLPDEAERKYYAAYYIEVLEAYQMKLDEGEIKRENELTITDMLRMMEGSKNYKEALASIGLTVQDVKRTRKKLENKL